MSPRDIRVRGGATAEELAAVLAVMAPRPAAVEDPYRRWRQERRAALRRTSGARGT